MTDHGAGGTARALGWALLSAWGGRAMSMLSFLVLGRLLAPEDFGLVALALVFVELGNVLTTSGFHRAIVQRAALDAEHLDAAFYASTAIGAVLTSTLFLAAPTLAGWFGEPEFAAIARVLCIVYLLNGLAAAPHALLHRRMAFRTFAIRQFLSVSVSGVAAVVVAAAGGGAWALVAQTLVASAVNLPVLWYAAGWRPALRLSRRHLRDLTGFGVTTIAIDIAAIGIIRVDDLIIGAVLGAQALGFYTVAYKVFAILLELVTNSVNAVLFPVFSRLQSDPDAAVATLMRTARYAAAIGLPIFAGLAALAPDVLLGVFGPQWGPSVPVMRILAGTSVVIVGTFFVREVVIASGRTVLELLRSFAELACLTGAFFVATRWGFVGVAWARLAVVVAFVPVVVLMVRAVLPVPLRPLARQYAAPFVAAVVMAGVVLVVRSWIPAGPGSLAALVLCAAVGAAVYVVLLGLVARPVLEEVAGPVVRRLQRSRHAA